MAYEQLVSVPGSAPNNYVPTTDGQGGYSWAPQQGGGGVGGVGIQSVEQTTTSTEDSGINVVTVTKTDGTTSTFEVRNGSKGGAGKSDYQYAQDGGYTGTEAEFAKKLAAEKFVNPNALTFSGAATGSYDGSEALTVEIPSGGGGGSAVTPELLYSGTAENVSAFQQNIDMKGHRRFCVIVGGTKGESTISINEGHFYLDGKRYKIFYYTNWLGATSTSYPEGCVIEHITFVDEDKIAITYQQNTISLDGIVTGGFQGNSSTVITPKLALLQGYNATNEDGIALTFSAAVESVTVYVFGY